MAFSGRDGTEIRTGNQVVGRSAISCLPLGLQKGA
jgi:hypothetical protein